MITCIQECVNKSTLAFYNKLMFIFHERGNADNDGFVRMFLPAKTCAWKQTLSLSQVRIFSLLKTRAFI